MGYYASAYQYDNSVITIPGANILGALDALDALPYLGGCVTVAESCQYVGFDTDTDFETGTVSLIGFDNKYVGVEELLDVLKAYVTPDSAFAFLGEDGAIWRWTPSGIQYATITWN